MGTLTSLLVKRIVPREKTASKELKGAWEELTDHLNVAEAYQSLHTYHNIPTQKHNLAHDIAPNITTTKTLPSSSRLDRMFHSLPQSAIALFTPTASVLARPRLRPGKGSENMHTYLAQDHLPVALTHTPTSPPKKRAFPHLPPHLAKDPSFRTNFVRIWHRKKLGRGGDVLERLDALRKVCFEAAGEVSRSTRPKIDELVHAHTLIKLLNLTKAKHNRKALDLIDKHSPTEPVLFVNGDIDPKPYLEQLDDLFGKHGEAEEREEYIDRDGFDYPPPPTKGRGSGKKKFRAKS